MRIVRLYLNAYFYMNIYDYEYTIVVLILNTEVLYFLGGFYEYEQGVTKDVKKSKAFY